MNKIVVFKKNRKIGDGKAVIPTYISKVNGKFINIRLASNVLNHINKSELKFPVEITLENEDMFISTKNYTNEMTKESKTFKYLVIYNFSDITHYDIKAPSLEEIIEQMKN